MRAMSEAIEGARDFRGMMDKIEAGAAQQANAGVGFDSRAILEVRCAVGVEIPVGIDIGVFGHRRITATGASPPSPPSSSRRPRRPRRRRRRPRASPSASSRRVGAARPGARGRRLRLLPSASASASISSSSISSGQVVVVVLDERRERGAYAGGGPLASTDMRAPSSSSPSDRISTTDAVAILDLGDVGALVVEEVEGRFLARAQRQQRSATARGLVLDQAQRGEARRRCGAHQAGALAMRAGAGRRLEHAGAQPLAAHFHQAEAARCDRPGCGRDRSSAPPSSPSRPYGRWTNDPCR